MWSLLAKWGVVGGEYSCVGWYSSPRLDPGRADGGTPSWCPFGTPFGIGPAPDETADASTRGSVFGVSTLVGVKLGVRCGVSTLVGVKSCLSPKDGSFTTVGAEDEYFDLLRADKLLA